MGSVKILGILIYISIKKKPEEKEREDKEGIIGRSRFWNDTCDWISYPGEAVSQNGDTKSPKTRGKQVLIGEHMLVYVVLEKEERIKKGHARWLACFLISGMEACVRG